MKQPLFPTLVCPHCGGPLVDAKTKIVCFYCERVQPKIGARAAGK